MLAPHQAREKERRDTGAGGEDRRKEGRGKEEGRDEESRETGLSLYKRKERLCS